MGATSESKWSVVFARCEVNGQITFEIRFLKLGEEMFSWVVPSQAHDDLANAFLKGGSFLKESIKHMKEEWELAKDIHPYFYALYEQEVDLPESAKEARTSAASKWGRL